ncbi:DUF3800 domain-containing protein [Sphingobium sp. DEHP117]|uniref:DUF3800 domain-containing protein n=1 Tax=Sphingobium sp. DEHP117 TaxID=2993436 RepID=UPI0027D4EDFA|nr:DUF3800 domain-containing protein [Sphingobium sp. DEHP117]MDQ4420781.1 DUF3800 domain-containing protein [Sphingobium sp. DEHP117]
MLNSNFIVYVDESGDANLSNPDPNFPMFVLAFCIFNKAHYVDFVSPSIQRFKFKYFGHDAVILHEREIRQQTPPFAFLKSVAKREAFMADLDDLVINAPFTVIAAVIDKLALKKRYARPEDPYHLSLKFCMERLQKYLVTNDAKGTSHIIFERRGHEEDNALELEFRRIKDGKNYAAQTFQDLEIVFAHKKINSGGLQLADLVARPIGLHQLRPRQTNRAYSIIEKKFCCNTTGEFRGFGLKCFP